MSFFSRAATSALTGFAILGFASSAFAGPVRHQPYVESESISVIRAVQQVGGLVGHDAGLCLEESNIMGYASPDGIMVICIDNHDGDQDELADTIRHEAVHIAQFCKGQRHGATSAVLKPDLIEESISIARDELGWDTSLYPERQWAMEGEARVMAYYLDESDIVDHVLAECS